MTTSRTSIPTAVAIVAALVAALLIAGPTAVQADTQGDTDACTPGYWKNHEANWEEYQPHWRLGNIHLEFLPDDPVFDQWRDLTLREALRLRGGPGFEGAARLLIKTGVAAYLNAAHDSLFYPNTRRNDLQVLIEDALSSMDRATIIALHEQLDEEFNDLACPL